MTDLLHKAGEALYGPRWQRETGKALGVTDRTVRRWVAGDPMPADIEPRLRSLIDKRLADLRKIRGRLSAK